MKGIMYYKRNYTAVEKIGNKWVTLKKIGKTQTQASEHSFWIFAQFSALYLATYLFLIFTGFIEIPKE